MQRLAGAAPLVHIPPPLLTSTLPRPAPSPAASQVLRVELARKQTMMFYQPSKDRLFLKIVLATPNLVAPARSEPGRWAAAGGRAAARPGAGQAGAGLGRQQDPSAQTRAQDAASCMPSAPPLAMRPTAASAADPSCPPPAPARPPPPCGAGLFERGLTLRWLNNQYFRSTTYESNVLYALRFMIDCQVVGGNWVELPAGAYSLVPPQVQRGTLGGCGCGGWEWLGALLVRAGRAAAHQLQACVG